MATFLAHIRVNPGREDEFEQIAAMLQHATHERESGVLRYEYWRGAEDRTYYTLASFRDFLAFIDHQVSEHHEAAGPGLMDVIETIRLEWVDPIADASPLPSTDPMPLPDGAGRLAEKHHARFGVEVPPWWTARRVRSAVG